MKVSLSDLLQSLQGLPSEYLRQMSPTGLAVDYINQFSGCYTLALWLLDPAQDDCSHLTESLSLLRTTLKNIKTYREYWETRIGDGQVEIATTNSIIKILVEDHPEVPKIDALISQVKRLADHLELRLLIQLFDQLRRIIWGENHFKEASFFRTV